MTHSRRKPYTPPADNYTLRPESGGNGTIHNRAGDTVGVIEGWVLFVDGRRVGEVDNYREALRLLTESVG